MAGVTSPGSSRALRLDPHNLPVFPYLAVPRAGNR